MLRRAALAGALIASVSCNGSEGGSALVASAGSARVASPGGNFSADLAKELAGLEKGSGAAAKPEAPAGAGSAGGSSRSGSAATSDPKAADVPAESAAASNPKAGDVPVGGAAGAKGWSDKTDKAAGAKAVGEAPTATGEVKPVTTGSAPAGQPAATAAQVTATPAHGPVKVPADLAAIKLALLPNWDRDIDQPGTFQYVVRIKGTQSTKTFAFRYGYDDPRAPADRDQYKKYLQDTRALTGEIRDRQRGAAWFLEGNDAAGMPAFRYVVLYGGKRLICYGSLYKDADSNRLGDDRDQTLIQAKQICETLAL